MAEYVDFHYMPLEGKITGKQVLKQTEDAINDIGEKVYSLDIDSSLIDEAIETSETAMNIAESALSAVTTGRSIWFNNVAEMMEFTSEVGVVAETKGYYLVNDGGGAVYIIRLKTGGDVVDGGSIIQLDDETMVAQLVTDGEVNVKQFGAMGNGVDDDSTAFQNTSTYAQTNGFTAFVALGTYNVTETITGTFNSFGEVTIVGGGTVDIVNLHDVVDDVTAIKEVVESSTTSAQASATSAATSATNAANSASSASTTAAQLMAYLEDKEEITAPAVDPTLTISGAAADAKVTGDKITELDGAVFERGINTIIDNLTRSATSSGTTNFVLTKNIASTQIVDIEMTLSTTKSSAQSVYWRNDSGNLNKIGDIPANADHVIFTGKTPNATANRLRINNSLTTGTYTVTITEKYVIDNIAKNATNIADTNEHFPKIGKRSPITEFGTFELGSWSGVNTFNTSNTNRVGCRTPIVFDKPVHLSAMNGYCMSGYRGTTGFSTAGTVTLPANTELRLYIRKVWEDSSVADVDTYTNGIYVLDYEPLTDYDRLLDTFAGIEMFRTAGFIGDSYTATRLGYSWVDIVQGLTGVQCTKYAKSGLNTRQWLTNASGLPALLADTQKDLYWIALGINDGDTVDENPSYLGSIADISGGDYTQYPNTYYGNMGHIIEAIQEHAPKAKIVLYKPIFKSVMRTLAGQSATQNGIKEVRDAIGEIAEHYSLPCMDALDDVLYQSGWYGGNMDSAVSNGTHPAVLLYPAIAKANLRLFARCVEEYRTYFQDIRYDT